MTKKMKTRNPSSMTARAGIVGIVMMFMIMLGQVLNYVTDSQNKEDVIEDQQNIIECVVALAFSDEATLQKLTVDDVATVCHVNRSELQQLKSALRESTQN